MTATPRNAVLILLDSLNRHMLGSYGGTEFDTPNLDAFAKRSVRFTNHYTGSLPCIPARHDLLCGTWDFLWKPWGSIEIWEEPITAHLRRQGVVTQLITDHPHLFEVGGENFHTDFTAWDYQRGSESDAWKTRPDPSWLGTPTFGRGWTPYDNSRGHFASEEDFPGPRTMRAAADWLRDIATHRGATQLPPSREPTGTDERFFLFVDEFDPHEPFDTPEPYASMYDEWEGPHLVWPPYTVGALERGDLNEAEARQIRASYGAKLTMIDRWFGDVAEALEDHWDDTAVFVATDHGHYLGEKDVWGKPASPVFQTLGHIPLLVAWPGAEPGEVDALTTGVDLAATVLDIFEAGDRASHGRSLVPLLDGSETSIRDHALCGVWGREVHLLTAGRKYARAPQGANEPLSMWSNRWSTMPLWSYPDLRLPKPDDRATLDRMPGSAVPVIRQPFREGDMLPYWAGGHFSGNHLYDLSDDPDEERNQAGSDAERGAADDLADVLRAIEAPSDQLERLGLA